jgi:hypothetical protein
MAKPTAGDCRQQHVFRQCENKRDYAHPRSPHTVIAITTPMQVARVNRLAIARQGPY